MSPNVERRRTSYPRDRIKILLLEGVHERGVRLFEEEGFAVRAEKRALSPDELREAIADVHVLGIRSKTQVSKEALLGARRMLALGCFCIGTNQVDLDTANRQGIPVFNAPFSNTRSVAELVIAEIIALSRRLFDHSSAVHRGTWNKSADKSYEVRGKTVGIVGYGHIGTQVGVLAEMLGMHVLYHDIAAKLPLGNARAMHSLPELLSQSDFVTLHVPETAQTKEMIGAAEIGHMKPGSYLLNLSRGTVVVIPALVEALKGGRLAGAAVDVYPEEPEKNSDGFKTMLQGLPNVILTPHVGGSTAEAQADIGSSVASALIKLINTGATAGAVNFPQIEPPPTGDAHRILNIHQNVPGVLRDVTRIVSDLNANIRSQLLATDNHIGYLCMDIDQDVSEAVRDAIGKLTTSIKTRILI